MTHKHSHNCTFEGVLAEPTRTGRAHWPTNASAVRPHVYLKPRNLCHKVHTGGLYLFYGAPLQHADRAVFYAYFLFTHSGLPSQGVVVFTQYFIYVAKS